MANADQEASRLRNSISLDKKRRTGQHQQSAPHFHNYYELFYTRTGKCRFFLSDRVYDLTAGDFLLIEPGDLHMSRYDWSVPYNDRFIIYFEDKKVDPKIRKYLNLIRDEKKFSVRPEIQEKILDYQNRMLELYLKKTEFDDLYLHFMFQDFLLFLTQNADPAESPAQAGSLEVSLEKAAQYISTHYADPLTLAGVAKIAGFTPTYFSRRFKEFSGTGFREFLNHVRLNNASQLLRSTDLSIQEISQRCGFSSSNYFGDSFRAAYGKSPREYRKADVI